MDIREIRRQNLIALRAQEGTFSGIAAKVDTDPNYLSQISSGDGKHNMGYRMARRLEKACGKPVGWMDVPHEDDEIEQDLSAIGRIARRMDKTQRRQLISFMESMSGGASAQ